jgi:hypothetical protein
LWTIFSGKTIVAGHYDYFIPFLFCRLFGYGHCDHSVNIVFESCQLVIEWVTGGEV